MKRELILSLEKKYKNIKNPYYLDYQYFYSNRNLNKSCFAGNLSKSNKKKQQYIKEANKIARNMYCLDGIFWYHSKALEILKMKVSIFLIREIWALRFFGKTKKSGFKFFYL